MSVTSMFTFIDLFCGAGGFAKGFELTGRFRCLGGIDNVEAAVRTHKANFPASASTCSDIRTFEPSLFAEQVGTNEVDVIIGGPPCPTFSTIGHPKIQSINRERGASIDEDVRNVLFMDYLKYVSYFRPKLFVMENVPQFLTKYDGATFQEVKRRVQEQLPEYQIVEEVRVLNSMDYGVPQSRRRMILVGCRRGYSFSYPLPTHGVGPDLLPVTTVGDAIGDLPKITDNWRVSECAYSKSFPDLTDYQRALRPTGASMVKNNVCRMSNVRAKQVFAHMKQGQKYMDLPTEVRSILPFREDIFPDRLKRLVWDRPSWTVLAHIGMDGYMYIHPTESRTLSVREAARIQSFPDDFEFIGNQQQTYVQVGNAVPPLLGKAIAAAVAHSLESPAFPS